ncbi:hypothetical protein HHI36_006188 [Cryptolaemus montrouzieri]|uniref:Uncharacterized protein n=1 Tax=Cryptolaemus montrouzieri TaxID=559131 RepID=A0ABD2NXA0_9CUCU
MKSGSELIRNRKFIKENKMLTLNTKHPSSNRVNPKIADGGKEMTKCYLELETKVPEQVNEEQNDNSSGEDDSIEDNQSDEESVEDNLSEESVNNERSDNANFSDVSSYINQSFEERFTTKEKTISSGRTVKAPEKLNLLKGGCKRDIKFHNYLITYVELGKELLERKTHLIGTVRKNRKGLPKSNVEKKIKKGSYRNSK